MKTNWKKLNEDTRMEMSLAVTASETIQYWHYDRHRGAYATGKQDSGGLLISRYVKVNHVCHFNLFEAPETASYAYRVDLTTHHRHETVYCMSLFDLAAALKTLEPIFNLMERQIGYSREGDLD